VGKEGVWKPGQVRGCSDGGDAKRPIVVERLTGEKTGRLGDGLDKQKGRGLKFPTWAAG
jgi:hypothetical protein